MYPTSILDPRADAASRMRLARLSFTLAAIALAAVGWLMPQPGPVHGGAALSAPPVDGAIVAALAVALAVWLLRSVKQAADLERALHTYRPRESRAPAVRVWQARSERGTPPHRGGTARQKPRCRGATVSWEETRRCA